MEHPLLLARAGKSSPVALFARNQLCALVRPDLAVTTANLLDRMMQAQTKLGTSTPRADPSGDYAWEMFRKADAQRPGAFAALSQKALQLTGAPSSVSAPAGRNLYGMLVSQGRADIFLAYCTNALEAVKQNPGQHMVSLPGNLAVGADYGLTVMSTASPAAYRFALFILSGDGQRILANHGFAAPGVPR
jgi:ABC-type molybdate transport system substrate-binding protein